MSTKRHDFEVVEETEEKEFSIGPSYDEHPVKKLRCKGCGEDRFYVGVGSHYTAIKCGNCQWESCIHDG